MIHVKSFVRHWACGSWLLAAGLVLGWAGEVAAKITLSVDKPRVREEAGATTITVTATIDPKDANNDTYVVLRLESTDDVGMATTDWETRTDDWKDWYDSRAQLNERFTITLPTIVIPKNTDKGTATLILTPKNNGDRGFHNTYDEFTIPKAVKEAYASGGDDEGRNSKGFHLDPYPDLLVRIGGTVGGNTVEGTEIDVIDDERLSGVLDLSFDPPSLSKEAGPTSVTVTATLHGHTIGTDETFNLVVANPAEFSEGDLDDAGLDEKTPADILKRDSEYSTQGTTLTLRKRQVTATATVTIDPKGKPGFIAFQGAAPPEPKGIDLNRDGDNNDEIALHVAGSGKVKLTEAGLGCDAEEDTPEHDVNFDGDCLDVIREARAGIDLNGDGTIDPPSSAKYELWPTEEAAREALDLVLEDGETAEDKPLVLDEGELKYKVTINPFFFEIKDTPLAAVKDDGLTASPASIREEAGRQEITLKVTLKAALLDDAGVSFTIEAGTGTRDVHYTVSVADLTIPAGATEGTTTLTLTPTNNSAADGEKSFTVVAEVGPDKTQARALITIVDDETLTEEIMLAVSPGEIKAGTGENIVTVTGTLDGQVFDEDVRVDLIVTRDTDANGAVNDDDKAAQRDTDYTAVLRPLTIPAGEVEGSTTVSITPINGGDKKVGLTALESPVRNADDEAVKVSTESVVLKDADPDAEVPDPSALSFGDIDLSSTLFEGTVGTALDPIELPEAEGGTGSLSYTVSSNLPAGLSFDAATRTISGTPTATTTGTASLIYTVLDSDPAGANSAAMIVTIEIGTALPPTVEVARVASTHSSVRENGEPTIITLTATLASASATDETVSFTIGAPSAGALALRDVDYTAVLGGVVTIAAGETQGTTTLILTPLDNASVDGNKYLGVQATTSGGSAQTDIKIADDETPSTTISLSVSPHMVSEAAGVTSLTITATLDGKALDEAATVSVSIDGGSVATRDVDYSALFNPLLVIPAGETSGSIALLIDPTADGEDEGDETITLNGAIAGLNGGSADITLSDAEAVAPEPEPTPLAFADGASVADVMSTAGTAIDPIELPAVLDGTGEGDVAYSVSELPAGLAFDAATRMLSGEPAEVSEKTVVEVTYTATDSEGATATLTFSITVNPALSFGDFFGQFDAAGKVIPTDSHDGVDIREFVVGQRVEAVLPEATGGTSPHTYSLSPALPAGLTFDAATRTIAGTPMAAGESVYTYTVTDANGASASLALQTLPAAFTLADNFPNPFNPETTIHYALPQAANVELTVYNVVGQPVRTLVAEHQNAGRYVVEWDATNDSGHSLSSGMYFYRLQAGDEFHAIKKMLLLK